MRLLVATSQASCYDYVEQNFDEYGKLYSWSSAIKACPQGWNLPSKDQWNFMLYSYGTKEEAYKIFSDPDGFNPLIQMRGTIFYVNVLEGFSYLNRMDHWEKGFKERLKGNLIVGMVIIPLVLLILELLQYFEIHIYR